MIPGIAERSSAIQKPTLQYGSKVPLRVEISTVCLTPASPFSVVPLVALAVLCNAALLVALAGAADTGGVVSVEVVPVVPVVEFMIASLEDTF